jgi:hypothetical protein
LGVTAIELVAAASLAHQNFVLSRNSVFYSAVLFRDVLVSGSRLYSTIFR